MAKTILDWNKIVIWDIETLCNCFIACFKDYSTGKRKEFIFYEDDDYAKQPKEFLKFLENLKKNDYTLLGFNSIGFDHQVIEYYMQNVKSFADIGSLIDGIYNTAQEVITTPEEERFKTLIPESKLSHKAIDLFKQKHYDGKAKRGTSLKALQFAMRYPNLEDMPYSHDKEITKEQINEILSYCWNDVDSTEEFFNRIKYETELRESLSIEFDKNLMNASEPRMAKEIFSIFLCKEMGIEPKELREMKTIRGKLRFKDLIQPYVSFYTDTFKKVLDDFNKVVIDASPNSSDSFDYSFNYNNIKIDLGLGGIHASIDSGIYEEDDEYIIEDYDVKSMYPNLSIKNRIKPEHLGNSFLNVYSDLYERRKTYDKKNPMNYIIKICLNSAYGLGKEFNSYLYDPSFVYSITLTGQMSILMLTEMFVEYVKDLQILQLNTDGILVRYKKKYKDRLTKIIKQFEKVTQLEMEQASYKKVIIRDCNNYIAVIDENNAKYKGAFEVDVDYHKNASALIIRKAVANYFLKDESCEKYINDSKNIYDFCHCFKTRKPFRTVLYKIKDGLLDIEELQKINRVIVSKNGDFIFKEDDDGRRIGILAKTKVTVLNKIKDEEKDLENIDRSWYVNQANDLINSVIKNKNLTLW
jgi:hypothetical protein